MVVPRPWRPGRYRLVQWGDGVGGHFGFPFRLCGVFPVFLSYIYYYTRRNYGAQGFWGRKKKTTPIRGATNSTEEKK